MALWLPFFSWVVSLYLLESALNSTVSRFSRKPHVLLCGALGKITEICGWHSWLLVRRQIIGKCDLKGQISLPSSTLLSASRSLWQEQLPIAQALFAVEQANCGLKTESEICPPFKLWMSGIACQPWANDQGTMKPSTKNQEVKLQCRNMALPNPSVCLLFSTVIS